MYAQNGDERDARIHLTQALQTKQTFIWTEDAKAMLARLNG